MWVRARVHRIAAKGKSCFITLRRGFSSIQMVLGNKLLLPLSLSLLDDLLNVNFVAFHDNRKGCQRCHT
jgi:aspartyl/asparaginyl-tRNA synthetase